jgi:hypothetical protein
MAIKNIIKFENGRIMEIGVEEKLDSDLIELSETDGNSLENKADGLYCSAGNVDLTEYYDKNEVDGLLTNKVDAVEDKGLSSNDFTDLDKSKLDSLTNVDLTEYYDKNEVDNLLTNKVDAVEDKGFLFSIISGVKKCFGITIKFEISKLFLS